MDKTKEGEGDGRGRQGQKEGKIDRGGREGKRKKGSFNISHLWVGSSCTIHWEYVIEFSGSLVE